MSQNANTRALQHLLLQGFTPYTCQAAVCTRLQAPLVLETHPWAVVMERGAALWCGRLLDDDPMRPRFLEAAEGASQAQPRVLCHYDGIFLALPLVVDEVRHAQARLEIAKNLSVVPTSLDGLAAVPDDILKLELRRRKKLAENQDSGRKDGQAI